MSFICFEYFGKFSLKSEKQLNEIFPTCNQNVKLNVVLILLNRIRNAFRFKDQVLKSFNSKVIYKYKCNIGNDAYIDETKRRFLVHQYESQFLQINP